MSYSFDDEFSTLNTNINGTHFVVAALKEVAPKCRFYFAGSSEMFGKAEEVPQTLVDQLAVDGIMVLPLGPHFGPQQIVKLTKSPTGVAREDLIAVRFVPLLPGRTKEL